MNEPNIYNLKLHETLDADDANLFTTVIRVPGGWMYRSYDKGCHILCAVFVPFNNEFQEHRQGGVHE